MGSIKAGETRFTLKGMVSNKLLAVLSCCSRLLVFLQLHLTSAPIVSEEP